MNLEGNNIMTVKRTNRSTILKLLHRNESLSRKKLAELTGLTPAAITKITSELIDDRLIYEGRAVAMGSVGRREVQLCLNTRAYCALGIGINIGKAYLSAAWPSGEVIFEDIQHLPENAPAETTIKLLCSKLMELAREQIPAGTPIIGVGITSRGIHSSDFRTIKNAYHALEGKNIPVADLVEEFTGYPAVLENNVRALLSAHLFLSDDGTSDSVFFVRGEYGIGGALSVGGEVWQGSSGQCSEIGHIPVVRKGGKRCRCGKAGCLETVASPVAIIEQAMEVMNEKTTPAFCNRLKEINGRKVYIEDVCECAALGDEPLQDIVTNAVQYLASAIRAVIYSIDPQKIILYGKMFESEYYLTKFSAEMLDYVDAYHKIPVKRCDMNLQLERVSAPLIAITRYIENGGII
mgnify:CR=1 FL=1